MNNEQALQIIKAALDEAVKNGTYKNLETIQHIIAALGVITNELTKKTE